MADRKLYNTFVDTVAVFFVLWEVMGRGQVRVAAVNILQNRSGSVTAIFPGFVWDFSHAHRPVNKIGYRLVFIRTSGQVSNCNDQNGIKTNVPLLKRTQSSISQHSLIAFHLNTNLLGGCESLLLVEADGTACPLPTAGLPAPVEVLPGMYVPPLAEPGDWTLRPPPADGAWTMGSPLEGWRPDATEPTVVTALTGARRERGDWPLLRSRLQAIPLVEERRSGIIQSQPATSDKLGNKYC